MPYIANKRNVAQLTNVHYWDSAAGPAAWSGNLIGAATSFAFLPTPVLAPDLVIFGVDTSVLDSGPFCSLVFDIGSVIVGVTAITWLYSSAAGADPNTWAGFVAGVVPFQDNTNAGGLGTGIAFDTSGVGSVHWEQPSGWIVQNPTIGGVALGVTGYWVCAEMTTVPGAAAPPTQANRNIYSILWPAIEVAAADVGGDIPALMRTKLRNESSAAGVIWSNMDSATRILAGLRSVDRGEDFASYINLSSEQNPTGMTVTAAGLGVMTADVQTPTGWMVRVTNPVAAWTEHATVQLDTTLAPQYQGLFHAFMRVDQTSGVAGDIDARLRVAMTLGIAGTNIIYTSDIAVLRSIFRYEVYDFGRMQIIPDDMTDSDIYTIEIKVELSGDSTADIDLFDVIVLPVDEWAGDFDMTVADVNFHWGYRDDPSVLGTIVDMDSVTVPRRAMNPRLRGWLTDEVAYRPRYIGRAPAIFQNDSTQQLHFFAIKDVVTDAQAVFELAGSTVTEIVQRYLSMRGDR